MHDAIMEVQPFCHKLCPELPLVCRAMGQHPVMQCTYALTMLQPVCPGEA